MYDIVFEDFQTFVYTRTISCMNLCIHLRQVF